MDGRRRGDTGNGLSRWSRLKRTGSAEREDVPAPGVDAAPRLPAVDHGPGSTPAATADVPASEPAPPPDLPSLEGLDGASDYRVFLQPHVPEELRRQALRLLWRSDPVLANLDGLNDYDEDYRRIGMVQQVVRTAYRVGKGYLSDAETADREETEPAVLADTETAAARAEAVPAEQAGAEQAGGDDGPPDELGRCA